MNDQILVQFSLIRRLPTNRPLTINFKNHNLLVINRFFLLKLNQINLGVLKVDTNILLRSADSRHPMYEAATNERINFKKTEKPN